MSDNIKTTPTVQPTASLGTIAFALLQNMRPKQWSKNGFVFMAILFDQKLFDADWFVRVLATFAIMCLTASAVYIINDIVDVEKDRQHPKKKFRPIASGRLPINIAVFAAIILFVAAVAASLLIDVKLTLVVLGYIGLHVAYSFVLKNIVIIDVFAIAGGFVLRVLAGAVVIEVAQFSPWLYMCAALLSLFLAVGKRRQEYILMGDKAGATRSILKEYNLNLINDMLRLTITTTAIAYTLYATESDTALISREYMLLTVPFVYYGLFRYLYLIYVKEHGGDPTEILFEDRPLQITIALWGLLLICLFYVV